MGTVIGFVGGMVRVSGRVAAGSPPARLISLASCHLKLLSSQFLMSLTGTKFAGHSIDKMPDVVGPHE
jgi:hypothetical protein